MKTKRIAISPAAARGRNGEFNPHHIEIHTDTLHHYTPAKVYLGLLPAVVLEVHSRRRHQTAPVQLCVTANHAMQIAVELIRAAQLALVENSLEEQPPPCTSIGSALLTSPSTGT